MADTCAPHFFTLCQAAATYPAPSQGQLPVHLQKTPGGPNLSEGPTLSQTSVSRVFGHVPSLAYMVAPGEKAGRDPFPQVLSWAAHLAGSQGESRASHGCCPSLCPPGHRALSNVSQEGLPPPPVCL